MRAREFRSVDQRGLRNRHVGRLILHGHLLRNAVCSDRELHGFGDHVAVGCLRLNQRVGLAREEVRHELVRVIRSVRHPAVHRGSGRIGSEVQGEMRAREFRSVDQRGLRNRHVGGLIDHGHGLRHAVGANREGDGFGEYIAIRRLRLRQRVLIACDELGDDPMGRRAARPRIDRDAVLVLQRELRAGQFLALGDALLGEAHIGGLILHDNGLRRAVGIDGERDGFRHGVSGRCGDLSEVVRCARDQLRMEMMLDDTGNPFINRVVLRVLQDEACAEKLARPGNRRLGDIHIGGRITHGDGLRAAIPIHRKGNGRRHIVAGRCSGLDQRVGLARVQHAAHCMRQAVRDPGFDHLVVRIPDFKGRAGQRQIADDR